MNTIDYKKSCFFTGHRIIAANDRNLVIAKTNQLCIDLIERHGVTNFICGGALGYDTLAARTVLSLKKEYPHIKLHLFLPCRDQTAKWNKHDCEVWQNILEMSDSHRYIYDGDYIKGCMQLRNRAMVDSAMFGIAYCKRKYGGSYSTIQLAQSKHRFICVIPENDRFDTL